MTTSKRRLKWTVRLHREIDPNGEPQVWEALIAYVKATDRILDYAVDHDNAVVVSSTDIRIAKFKRRELKALVDELTL